jgi:hypothetical protein
MRNYWVSADLTLVSESPIEEAIEVQGEDGLISEQYLFVENGILKKNTWPFPNRPICVVLSFENIADIAADSTTVGLILNSVHVPKIKTQTGFISYYEDLIAGELTTEQVAGIIRSIAGFDSVIFKPE